MAALVAVYMAVRAEGRSRKVGAAQLYLELRSRMISLYTQLGDMDSTTATDAERKARAAYWHHCYDEWYLSTRLAPEEFGALWEDFYKQASRSGLRHAGLRSALEELTSSPHSKFADYAGGFIEAIGFRAGAPDTTASPGDGTNGADETNGTPSPSLRRPGSTAGGSPGQQNGNGSRQQPLPEQRHPEQEPEQEPDQHSEQHPDRQEPRAQAPS
jgi:hypothetical protein